MQVAFPKGERVMTSLRNFAHLVSGLFASALAIGMVASAQPALAQNTQLVARANIPFAFQAGSKVMPAGTYDISKQHDHVLILRESHAKAAEFLMVQDTYATHTPKQSAIVFDRRGDKYFLRQVWTANNGSGVECPKPRAEKELEIAQKDAPQSTVTLALNTSPKR
jgi:hypothetical protein